LLKFQGQIQRELVQPPPFFRQKHEVGFKEIDIEPRSARLLHGGFRIGFHAPPMSRIPGAVAKIIRAL